MSSSSLASTRGAPSATRHAPRHAHPAARGPSAFSTRRPRNSTPLTTLCQSHNSSSPAEPATAQSRRSALALLATTTSAAASLLLLPPAPAALAKGPTTDPGDWSSPGLGAPIDPAAPKFVKLPSGVRYQELNVGTGPQAAPGDQVLFDYVLRRSNGYFIYGTVEGVSFQPRDVPTGPVSFKLGAGELIPGLEEVLTGMAPGSKRRAVVPPELGYVGGGEQPQPPTFATKRQLENHRNEPLLFEVQMLRVAGKK